MSSDLLLLTQINEIKTFGNEPDDSKIISTVSEMNKKSERELLCSEQFITEGSKTDLANTILSTIKGDDFSFEVIMPLYVKVINPVNILKQLLQFELENIVYPESKADITVDNIKTKVIQLLTRYQCACLDDEEWEIKYSHNQLKFRNTYLNIDHIRTEDYMNKIVRIIKQIYPKTKVIYKCKESTETCSRRIVSLIFEL